MHRLFTIYGCRTAGSGAVFNCGARGATACGSKSRVDYRYVPCPPADADGPPAVLAVERGVTAPALEVGNELAPAQLHPIWFHDL